MINHPDRNVIDKRTTYQARADFERFIVPLLEEQIKSVFQTYASPASNGARSLDVGCGSQPLRSALETMGYAYTSLDAMQNPTNTVDYICVIDREMPTDISAEKPFDFVVCTEVLEHVADWKVAFANITTLTAPGGLILITCPFFYLLHEVPYDFWRPTIHALRHFAVENGLEIVKLEGVGNPWDVLGTFAASCQPITTDRSLSSRLLCKFVAYGCKLLWRVSGSSRLRKIEMRSSLFPADIPFYQSNVAVLRKPV